MTTFALKSLQQCSVMPSVRVGSSATTLSLIVDALYVQRLNLGIASVNA